MDRYRLPASYGMIGGLLFQQHVQAVLAEAERQDRIADALDFWRSKFRRAWIYLVGGLTALLYFNDWGVWNTAMTVGACATGVFSLLWIVWVAQVHPDEELTAIWIMWILAIGAHVTVLIWGWTTDGAAAAVPWLFIEFGILGIISGFMQFWKNSNLW
ncbi:hypothetical protein ACIF8T_40270 [Streptomyces sp. NPDC085946]|uniref:hypothetical protein n=1 Tax=Streptomyces sp. NPDC085946 TaxID=3365744 RepID=UPI0037D34734